MADCFCLLAGEKCTIIDGDNMQNKVNSKLQPSTKEQVQRRLARLQAHEPLALKAHLDSLNDGIIAIIITIMVLEIPLPSQAAVSYHDFLKAIFIFGVSFFVVANFWYELNRILLMLKQTSKQLIICDFIFLAVLGLLPVLTKWMMVEPSRLAVLDYGVAYLAANLMKTVISVFAWEQLFTEIDGSPHMFAVKMGQRLLLLLIINVILLILAWFLPRWILLAYLLMSILDFFFPEKTAVDQHVQN